jgi:hypothetical protein
MQRVMQLLPDAILRPFTKVVIDGLIGREVMRQQVPLTTSFEDVEDSINDFTFIVFGWATTRCHSGQPRAHRLPFGIGQVGCVRCAVHNL